MQVIHIYLIPTSIIDDELYLSFDTMNIIEKKVEIHKKDLGDITNNFGYHHYFLKDDEDITTKLKIRSDDKDIKVAINKIEFANLSGEYLYIFDWFSNGHLVLSIGDYAIELHLYPSFDGFYARHVQTFITEYKKNIHAIYINDIPLTTFASSYKKAKSAIGTDKEIKDIAEELGISAMTFMKA